MLNSSGYPGTGMPRLLFRRLISPTVCLQGLCIQLSPNVGAPTLSRKERLGFQILLVIPKHDSSCRGVNNGHQQFYTASLKISDVPMASHE